MLRPEMSSAMRAAIVPPPSFQIQPVLREMVQSDILQSLRAQQQTARIEALQASLRHEVAKNDRQRELMVQAAETIASLRARLTAKMPDYIDVVRSVPLDGDEFLCGFIQDGASLHLEVMYAIGAVNVSSFDSDCMASQLERKVEEMIEQEKRDAAYNKGADRHEFNLAFGG